ncbi:N-acetyltransferase [Spirochaetia bacterium]|nr:N-acetyltransferase [Spirochaetia bacterium]
MDENIPDKNLFMMCSQLNRNSLSELSKEYYIRNCRENELDIWKAMPFDQPETAIKYYDYMTEYFNNVYGNKRKEFFNKCLFVCNKADEPIGTCFIWKVYNKINSIHWFKTLKSYEGKGIGRALLSVIMKDIPENEYPIYLHTQPSSYRAIKLYSDFGFKLISDPIIGNRNNDLDECLPILKKYMPKEYFKKLKITNASKQFIDIVCKYKNNEF